MGVKKVELALKVGRMAIMTAMVQAMEYLTIRCHKAFVCQSPQMTVISLRSRFDAAMLSEVMD